MYVYLPHITASTVLLNEENILKYKNIKHLKQDPIEWKQQRYMKRNKNEKRKNIAKVKRFPWIITITD